MPRFIRRCCASRDGPQVYGWLWMLARNSARSDRRGKLPNDCAPSATSIFVNPECNDESEENPNPVRQRLGYPASHIIQAPGRVQLIRQAYHDYNDGFTLLALRYRRYQTVISCAPRDARTVRVIAADYDNQTDEFSRRADYQPRRSGSPNYVRGVVASSAAAEQPLPSGADLVIPAAMYRGSAGVKFLSLAGSHLKSARRVQQLVSSAAGWRLQIASTAERKTSSSAATAASWIN